MSENIAIIFAGGSGVRLGSGLPKQFLEVGGKPIIIHTLEIFEEHPKIDAIYVACKEEYIDRLEKMIERYRITKVAGIVKGGATGQASIFNALKAASKERDKDAVVLIHDGVRPFIPAELIDDCLDTVEKYGNAVTCAEMTETPLYSGDGVFLDELPKRDEVFLARAPQCFHLGEVMEAHEAVRGENPDYIGIIDTCTLMKNAGYKVTLVKGPRSNIKVTMPEDIFIFRSLLEYRDTQDVFGINSRDIARDGEKE